MTKVIKFILAASIVAPALIAGSAFAATISGSGTAVFSGQTNLYGNAGQTKQVSTNFDIPTGQVLHAVQTDFIGDNQPPLCHVVSVYEGAQTNISVSFSEVLPPNAGDYGYTETAFTATTVDQANALNQNPGTACTGTNNLVYNQGSVVHVLPTGGVTSGSTGGTGTYSFMGQAFNSAADFFAWMKTNLGIGATPTPTPTPTTDPVCVEFKGDVSMTSQGNSDMPGSLGPVSILQSFLMSKGYDIPLLRTQAAKYGYFGTQTAAAVQAFRSGHPSCN